MRDQASLRRLNHPVSDYQDWSGEGVALWWLGQAGFLIRFGDLTIVIDAYLSDVLAQKYRGQVYPHRRMMAPPLAPEALAGIDYFLCSHSHSDHMDPGLIPSVVENNPDCRFIMPEAVRETGLQRGVPPDSLIGVDAGETTELSDGTSLSLIPSAHETLLRNDEGHHVFLGFIFRFGGLGVYHPGDSIPYPGLEDWLSPHRINLALMPVNGRKEELSRRGIAGNFSFSQAREIADHRSIDYMIPHHFGMFDFNTVDRSELDRMIAESGTSDRTFPAETGIMYHLTEIA